MVHILPHWNWPDEFKGKAIPVWAYTNADSVELFLNGTSLGRRDWTGVTATHLAWHVPYAPGTLRAVARKDGKSSPNRSVETTDAAARGSSSSPTARRFARTDRICRSSPSGSLTRAGRLSRVDGESARRVRPHRARRRIAGVDNGDPTNHEPFKGVTPQTARHSAFNGLALVVLKSTRTPGTLVLRARADGLTSAEARIQTR